MNRLYVAFASKVATRRAVTMLEYALLAAVVLGLVFAVSKFLVPAIDGLLNGANESISDTTGNTSNFGN